MTFRPAKMSALLPALLAIGGLLSCGRFAETPLAGGSGAGNPGGTIAFAIVAHSSPALGKTGAPADAHAVLVDSSRSVTIHDRSGLAFTLTDVSLRSLDLRFMLDTSEKPSRLLHEMRERPDYLDSDTNCIVLRGASVFDVLNGSIEPAAAIVRLPVGKYNGIRLYFRQNLDTPRFRNYDSGQITMAGTFFYGGTTHKVRVNINHTFSPLFRFAGGMFTLSPTDTTHIELSFNAQKWFSNVDFTSVLIRHRLSFDSTGCLNISSGWNQWASPEIEETISHDFIASGKLMVY